MRLSRNRNDDTVAGTDTERSADETRELEAYRHGVHDGDAREHDAYHENEALRHQEFGGFNWGAAFFGWLIAVAMTVLVGGIIGAVAAAVGNSLNLTQSDAERRAGTFGIATAIALVAVLMIAYFLGGYVAGRMSRYDGGRQGFGVWVFGLLATVVVVVLGWIFGAQYDVFQRVDLPSMPVPTDKLTVGGFVTLAVVIVATLLAASAGGKAGQRYHKKVDRFPA